MATAAAAAAPSHTGVAAAGATQGAVTASEAIPWSSGWRREAAEAGAHGRRRRGEEAARGVGEAERSVGNGG